MTLASVDFGARFQRAAGSLGLPKLAAEADELPDVVEETGPTAPTIEVETTQGENEESVGVPPVKKPATVTAENLFQHPDTHPIMLDLVLLRKYGPEWLEWEPETLELRIPFDFKGQNISDINMHKVQACKTLHFNENFWSEWEVFVWCCMAFNGVPPDFEVMQVPTVAQCMVAVDVANKIRDDVQWGQEMNDYIEQVHMHDGIFCPIEPLTWVTMDDVEEYPVDCDEVRRRWPEVRKEGKQLPSTTVENEQLNRLLDVREYLEEARAELRAQLPLATHV
jgi:hypothetical protein